MLTLMLLRHGKSDWDAQAGDDHSRPLAPRGERSARAIGIAVDRREIEPDVVISSTAVRARTTAELAMAAGGWVSTLVLDQALYGASVSDTLTAVGRHTDDAGRVLLVGHQPTWGMVVRALTGGSVAMRTGTLAEIELPISHWGELPTASGSLVSFTQSRQILREQNASHDD